MSKSMLYKIPVEKRRRTLPSFPMLILYLFPSRTTTELHRTPDVTVTSYPGGSLVGTVGSPENKAGFKIALKLAKLCTRK